MDEDAAMSRRTGQRYAWVLAAAWALSGCLVSVGSTFLLPGGPVPLILGAGLAVWLAWNVGLRRECWAVLVGGAGWPLAVLWSYRGLACPVGEMMLCANVPFVWKPWVVLAVALFLTGVLLSLCSARADGQRHLSHSMDGRSARL